MNIKKLTEEILYKVDIREYISTYYNITFKKVGSSYVAKCVFHNDSTPSLSIKDGGNYFNCFGCDAGGTVIQFVEKYESCSKEDAITKICNNVGISVDNKRECTRLTTYSNSKKDASIRYITNLVNENKEALEYLMEDRNLSLDTIKKFKLGATLNNEKKQSYNNRVVFPITNSTYENDILAFAYGYIKDKSKYDVKYINESGNEFFKKSTLLYGYNESISSIYKNKEVILVEGYFDVLSMHDSGLDNTVGVMCSNISEEQIELLKKLKCKVTLFLDNDSAGIEGMKRSIIKFIQHGIIPKIIITNYNDADELCTKMDKHKYDISRAIENGEKDAILFLLENDLAFYNNSVLKLQSELLSKIYPILDWLPELEKDVYKNYLYSSLKK